ncbi:hypothetical protein G714_04301 [Escherichia coli HVH 39 (4-2679949)]|uniref:hypothetical protein n=1 Tax=Escherichia coli TaxID=562 RepID=UPI00038F31FB|nr:hypothetical protein [Escherichia coli]EQO38521.1 hypothetical protein G714_04301 [Escherichia coli HVH 39 (4-2679949)]
MNSKIYYKIKKLFNSEISIKTFFEQGFCDLDYKHIAALSALVFVEDKINTNKLNTYSDIIVRLNLDDFAFAIVCLYEMYQDNDIFFSMQEKKNISLSILDALAYNHNPDFDEYHRRLAHAISGLYQADRYLVKDNGDTIPLYGIWHKNHKDSTQILSERSNSA